jgi:predicted ATPase
MEEALQSISEAQDHVRKTGECFWESEVYRIKGKILMVQPVADQSEAEFCFNQAIEIARRQQSKSLELRAAKSLARLWRSQDRQKEAFNLLTPVYEWFTEGFNTADLKDARALLDELD